jgi:hypothetical protein
MTSVYAHRRAALAAQLGNGGVAIIPTAPERARNRDSDFPYRHDSYFYYLSWLHRAQCLPGDRTPTGTRPCFANPKIWSAKFGTASA